MAAIILHALLFMVFIIARVTSSYVEEEALYSKLLNNYTKSIRPSVRTKQPIQIQFKIVLQRVRSYNLKEQVLILTAFTMMSWKDVRLQWNESDYDGIDRMNFDSSEIWTPDITLYNTAYGERESYTDTYPSKAIVMSGGRVVWNMPVIWYASCQSDITWFPMDKQTCDLDFGSWSYSRSQIEIISWLGNYTTSKKFAVPNGEWKVKETTTTYSDESFSCCPERFSIMRFSITIEHLSGFYFIYILIPLIVLLFLFLLVFYIPRNSGERLGFGITVILSITVYLLVISDKLPEKSDVDPMLGIIFTVEFFVLCFGLAIAACSISVTERHKRKPPSFLMKLPGLTSRISPFARTRTCKRSVETETSTNMERMDSLCQENNEPEKNDIEKSDVVGLDFNAKWIEIADWLDKVGFFIVFILIIVLPLIVVASLDTSGKR